MQLIWTAFLLGLVGSLHCAAMCGPLTLAVVNARRRGHPFAAVRLVYHAGRIATYCAIGLMFGIIGKTFALAGLQRWLSIMAGTLIMAGLLLSSRAALKTPFAKLVVQLKSAFSRLLQRRSLASHCALGAINGLLPCGLVYIAAAGAATTGHPLTGALHMAAFGAGTLPMMLGIGAAASRLPLAMRYRQLVPVSVAIVAALLVLRGLELDIPYLSPAASAASGVHCH